MSSDEYFEETSDLAAKEILKTEILQNSLGNNFLLKSFTLGLFVNVSAFVALGLLGFGLSVLIATYTNPRVYGDKCTQQSDCPSSANLVCFNGKCDCKTDYFYYSFSDGCVALRSVSEACTDDSQCCCNLYCSNQKCACTSDRYWDSPSSFCVKNGPYGASCAYTSDCQLGTSMVCLSDSTCGCSTGSYWSSSACVPVKNYLSTCQISAECNSTRGLTCNYNGQLTGTCTCKTNYYWDSSAQTCQTQNTYLSACTSTRQCKTSLGLYCDTAVNYKCICASNYYWNSTLTTCVKKATYQASCTVCDDTLYLTCGTYNFCVCSGDLNWNGSICVNPMSSGMSCLNSKKCDTSLGLSCDTTSYQCVCASTYFWSGSTCILKKGGGVSCTYNIQCQTQNGLTCSGGFCSCSTTNYWTGTTCLPRTTVNTPCTVGVNPCQYYYGLQCISNFCECSTPNYWNGTRCVSQFTRGVACTNDYQCASIYGLICDTTCRCPFATYWNGTMCLNQNTNGTTCTATNQCLENRGLVCLSGKCTCTLTKYWDGTQCSDRASYNQDCTVALCRDDLLLTCNASVCKCSGSTFWVTSKCQYPVGLNQYCDSSTYVCSANLNCIGSICQCAANKYYDTGTSSCVNFKSNGASCNSWTVPCNYANGLYCQTATNTCGCRSNAYWGGTSCVNKVGHNVACTANIQCLSSLGLICATANTCECSDPVTSSYFSLNDNLCHTCPTGFTSNSFPATYNTNYCYYVDTTPTDFDSAKALCSTKAAGATLLRIVDSTTLTYAIEFASLFIISTGSSSISLWTDSSKNAGDDINYKWGDGSAITSTYYYTGFPSTGLATDTEALTFYYDSTANGLKNALIGTSAYVICQYGI